MNHHKVVHKAKSDHRDAAGNEQTLQVLVGRRRRAAAVIGIIGPVGGFLDHTGSRTIVCASGLRSKPRNCPGQRMVLKRGGRLLAARLPQMCSFSFSFSSSSHSFPAAVDGPFAGKNASASAVATGSDVVQTHTHYDTVVVR
jgi:hypothetical protein